MTRHQLAKSLLKQNKEHVARFVLALSEDTVQNLSISKQEKIEENLRDLTIACDALYSVINSKTTKDIKPLLADHVPLEIQKAAKTYLKISETLLPKVKDLAKLTSSLFVEFQNNMTREDN